MRDWGGWGEKGEGRRKGERKRDRENIQINSKDH
jgi:hypothetical protein